MIEELPDIKLTVEDYYEYHGIELLDYVFEVANHFLPNISGEWVDSRAPAIFCGICRLKIDMSDIKTFISLI